MSLAVKILIAWPVLSVAVVAVWSRLARTVRAGDPGEWVSDYEWDDDADDLLTDQPVDVWPAVRFDAEFWRLVDVEYHHGADQ